jgi:hypothetical protein
MLGGKAGVRRKITLGDYPELSVADARKRAASLRNEVINKTDPAAAIQAKAVFTEPLAGAWGR